MIPWERRPVEVASLLNPAFCGEVFRRCVKEYETVASSPFPFPLIFLVLPIILHSETRKNLPTSSRTQLYVWLQSHHEVKVGFAERMRQLVPITRETLMFLLQLEAFIVDEKDAGLSVVDYKPSNESKQDEEEIVDCYNKAKLIGRWFARSGTPATIYSAWGVKP